jgi:hypothetical protein
MSGRSVVPGERVAAADPATAALLWRLPATQVDATVAFHRSILHQLRVGAPVDRQEGRQWYTPTPLRDAAARNRLQRVTR